MFLAKFLHHPAAVITFIKRGIVLDINIYDGCYKKYIKKQLGQLCGEGCWDRKFMLNRLS
jgi:hypothetical protein